MALGWMGVMYRTGETAPQSAMGHEKPKTITTAMRRRESRLYMMRPTNGFWQLEQHQRSKSLSSHLSLDAI